MLKVVPVFVGVWIGFISATGAMDYTNQFFNASQTATVVSSNINTIILQSGDYQFTYSADGYWAPYAGGTPTGRFFSVFWPNGIQSQAITAGPLLGKGANIIIRRADGKRFNLARFTGKLLANTAGTGGAFEIMPLINGEDAFNDPVMFDASGYGGQSFAHAPMLQNYDTYKIHLWVDWALTSLTLVDTNPPSAPVNFTVTASVLPTGAGTVSGAGSYASGADATVSAAANLGFIFSHWTDNGINAGSLPDYSFTVNTNHALVAVFTTNTPPVANGGTFYQLTNTPLAINIADLMAFDTDADGDWVAFIGTSAMTAHGLMLTNDGGQIFIPAGVTNDSFTYTIYDGNGGSATGTAHITSIHTPEGNPVALDLNAASGTATVNFSGVPWYFYEVQRATNAAFAGSLQIWSVQAAADGAIYFTDDFADLGGTPAQSFYRLLYLP